MDVINLWGRTRDVVSVGMGQLDARRPARGRRRGRRGGSSCPTPSPRRASSTAPTTSSSPSKASPPSTPRGAWTTSASPPTTARRSHDEYTQKRLPQGQRRGEARLGPLGRRRGPAAPVRGRLPRRRGRRFPEWKPGTEFKARRDAMLKRTPREGPASPVNLPRAPSGIDGDQAGRAASSKRPARPGAARNGRAADASRSDPRAGRRGSRGAGGSRSSARHWPAG